MQIYYYKDQWIEGPVSKEDIESLIKDKTLNEDSPVWAVSQKIWHPAIEFCESSQDTALISFDDKKNDTKLKDYNKELPYPKCLLALRNAYEQELITYNQCERLLGEIFESPDNFKHLPQLLHARGWITPSQRKILEDSTKPPCENEQIGNYEIIRELGSGGMGTTYLAKQISMDRIVALKVLQPALSRDAEYVRRFEREAKMAAKLNHNNIATAYEVGSEAGKHFMSMEFIEGETLAQKIESEKILDEETASDIIRQASEALQHASEHNLVHRDISPKNIIIRPDGIIKLIDMGLARSVSQKASALTAKGTTLGTPAYMSPEQCAGKDDLDIRSDIYSLGCVFYECITGEAPLVGETMFETLSLHINNEVPPVSNKNPEVSDLVCHIIQKMVAKVPEDRYQTPNEIIEGFEADHQTVKNTLEKMEDIKPISEQLKEWDNSSSVEIKLKCNENEYTHLIARKLEQKLEEGGFDPEFQGYVQTIFTELIANAFDHGCKNLKRGVVRISLDLNEAFFKLEVEDPGPGFAARQMLEKIKKEPLNRERRRGIMQILAIADNLEYSADGKRCKSVIYKKSQGSGIFSKESDGITYVEIKGKGDLALSEEFRKWVDNYPASQPERVCLMIRTEWVSSMFVGTIGKLHSKLKDAGSALSVWAEHRSCYKIMQQLGVTTFVRIQDSLEQAVFALRYETIGSKTPDSGEKSNQTEEKAASSGKSGATTGISISPKDKNGTTDKKNKISSRFPAIETSSTTRRRLTAKKSGNGMFNWIKGFWGK